MRRFLGWLLRNYDCCEECDTLEAWNPNDHEFVTLFELDGRARYMLPVAVKGQRPRFPGDGAQV